MGTPLTPENGLPEPKISEQVDARTRAESSHNTTRINQEHVRARKIDNRVDNGVHAKTFVISGGVVLAVVLAFIWWQVSSREDIARAEGEYRALAQSACSQITASATLPLPELGPGGPVYAATAITALLDAQGEAIARQSQRLQAVDAPPRLVAQRDAVVDAATATVAALASVTPQVATYGDELTLDEIRSLNETPAGADATAKGATLADALSDLGGKTCTLSSGS